MSFIHLLRWRKRMRSIRITAGKPHKTMTHKTKSGSASQNNNTDLKPAWTVSVLLGIVHQKKVSVLILMYFFWSIQCKSMGAESVWLTTFFTLKSTCDWISQIIDDWYCRTQLYANEQWHDVSTTNGSAGSDHRLSVFQALDITTCFLSATKRHVWTKCKQSLNSDQM